MAENYYQSLMKKYAGATADQRKKSSIDWFKEAAFEDDAKIRKSLKLKSTMHTNTLVPGQMYFFAYDAKNKDSLPYWDAFPLIFPLDDQGQHFLGLNMHYLQPNLRAKLFDVLTYDGKNKPRANQMVHSYNTLKQASKFQLFQPCLKKYLKSHMQSRFIHIPPESWEDALFLPVADWRNATHSHVWKKTRRK